MRKPYKNPNSNAHFAAAGFYVEKFKKRGVKFFALQNAGFFVTKFGSTKFCGAEPRAHDAAEFAAKSEKFCGMKRRGAGA